MAWDFETDPAFQEDLDWVDAFIRTEVASLDHVLGSPFDVRDENRNRLVRPLQQKVKARRLWACHLGPELGGQGYGQVKLALLNEIIGRSVYGPTVFGCQAPDSGNAEILAHYGTEAQKKAYLAPLLNNEIVSCFAMTEPQGGADPGVFTSTATRVGNEWRIDGEKWFASNARFAAFFIVMVVTDADAPVHRRTSMLIVPTGTPGLNIARNVGYGDHADTHAYLRFENCRVPADHMLGKEGEGFVVAQVRLGGGRIHHAMRTIAMARACLDAMCERVLSRRTQGQLLSEKQMVQEKIADSWVEIEQFRLLVLRTAWLIDKHSDYRAVLKDIAAVKAAMPKVLHDIAGRALHLHGSIGLSREMPFAQRVIDSYFLGLADGPTEVHKVTDAKQVLRQYKPANAMFPGYHLPAVRERAFDQYGDKIQGDGEATAERADAH
jgi:acyl-CoA dehydrogenase